MDERNERQVLNGLIDTCLDGERGFRYAANHVSDPAVKKFFLDVASERERFAAELLPHAQRLGGADAGDGTVTAALHRGWMTLKDSIRHDNAAIIREAERGERAALEAYEDALAGMLPPSVRETVESQCAAVRQSHQRLDALAEAESRRAHT